MDPNSVTLRKYGKHITVEMLRKHIQGLQGLVKAMGSPGGWSSHKLDVITSECGFPASDLLHLYLYPAPVSSDPKEVLRTAIRYLRGKLPKAKQC